MNDHSTCNDVAIGRDGSAYVTDSAAPESLRLPPGATQLEEWARDLSFAPPIIGGGVGADLTNDKWLRAYMNHPRYPE